MKGKKRLLFLWFVPVVIIMFFGLPWLLINLGIQAMPDPLKPKVARGEFPIRLEYEIDGQIVVIDDILLCEYDGFGANEGNGKYRKWKKSLSDGREHITLLEHENAIPIREWKSDEIAIYQEIFFNPGAAGYYMGDTEQIKTNSVAFPDASYFEKYEDGSTMSGTIAAEELYDTFAIKLLDWACAQPIKNEFS